MTRTKYASTIILVLTLFTVLFLSACSSDTGEPAPAPVESETSAAGEIVGIGALMEGYPLELLPFKDIARMDDCAYTLEYGSTGDLISEYYILSYSSTASMDALIDYYKTLLNAEDAAYDGTGFLDAALEGREISLSLNAIDDELIFVTLSVDGKLADPESEYQHPDLVVSGDAQAPDGGVLTRKRQIRSASRYEDAVRISCEETYVYEKSYDDLMAFYSGKYSDNTAYGEETDAYGSTLYWESGDREVQINVGAASPNSDNYVSINVSKYYK